VEPAANQVAEAVAACLAGRGEGIVAVYLFGSVARGTAGPGSDVDLGILFDAAPPRTLAAQPYDLEADLERALGRPVDIIVLNTAPSDLRSRVLRDGQLIVDRDRSARIAFEVRTRNEAFDLEPVLRRYRAGRRSPA
jgi:predicted nucleotidyltransferase